MDITKFSLQNSKSLRTTRLLFACLGIIILFSIPREHYPDVPLYYVHILVPYPGASAVEIEKEITQKIEQRISELSDITQISSLISDELSFTRVSYSQSISKRKFKNNFLELQSLINNLSLPSNSKTPIIDNFTYLDFMPIVSVVVYTDEESENGLDNLMTNALMIQSYLERVDNVSRISHRGLLDKSININLDYETLQDFQLSLFEISQSIQKSNINIPAGTINTKTSTLSTFTQGTINTIDGLDSIIIRQFPPSAPPIYLEDIANTEYYYDQSKIQIRYNGQQAVLFNIYKTENSDSINIVSSIDDTLQSIKNVLPPNIYLDTVANTTIKINNSIEVLISNALLGLLLLCITMLFFLGWRPALISTLEIPFTFATSFLILKLFNITLNTSTLFALVLVLGMIVDHSIVILENIIRLQSSRKMDKLQAISQGVNEIKTPIISSTMTTIGTFLPLAFLPGLIGKFLLPVPITIVVTLVISTISALFIIPTYYKNYSISQPINEHAMFIWGQRILSYVLKKILPFRILVCILSFVLVGVSIWFIFQIPVSLYDTEEESYFFVDITLPIGSNLDASNRIITEMEHSLTPLLDQGKITSIISSIGDTKLDEIEGLRFDKPHNAQLQIETELEESTNPVQDMTNLIQEVQALLSPIEGEYSLRTRRQRTGPPTKSALEFRVLGDDYTSLYTIEQYVQDTLAEYPEIYDIKTNLISEKPVFFIQVDEAQAVKYGLNVASIGQMIRQWLSNDEITTLFINNHTVPVIATIDNITQEDLSTLQYIHFPSPSTNTLIPFDEVASIVETTELNSIYREDGKRMLKITADAIHKENIKHINNEINSLYENSWSTEYPNTLLEMGGEFDEFSSLLEDILLLLLIGLFVVYIILITEFNSYIQPLLIMLTILFTIIGVSAYLFVSKSSLSITVLYSFVALVGVVVNGAIVLISTANALKEKHNISHIDAIKQASIQRLRPIILTSFTTIAGILPTALGIMGKSPIWQPMAATITVGLLVSTLTTLIIIPSFYALIHKK